MLPNDEHQFKLIARANFIAQLNIDFLKNTCDRYWDSKECLSYWRLNKISVGDKNHSVKIVAKEQDFIIYFFNKPRIEKGQVPYAHKIVNYASDLRYEVFKYAQLLAEKLID